MNSYIKKLIKEYLENGIRESKYDAGFREIRWMGNYTDTIENVKISSDSVEFTFEDEDSHEVNIKYNFKKTNKGIAIRGEWERETSSTNSRDDFGKTKPHTSKNKEEVVELFLDILPKKDQDKISSLKI